MHTVLCYSAVPRNLARTEWVGAIRCREVREQGKSRNLWRRHTRIRRTTQDAAIQDAIDFCRDIQHESSGVDITIKPGT